MATSSKISPIELAQALQRFRGSESFERIGFGHRHLVSEGVKYRVEQAGSCWLAEAIASYQMGPTFHGEGARFQGWYLAVNGSQTILWCEFEVSNIVVQQLIPYTDFPLGCTTEDVTQFDDRMAARLRRFDAFRLFAARNQSGGITIMLPSEY
jgi:hypothetical protein